MFLVNLVKNTIDFLSAPQYLVTAALIGLVLLIHWAPIWSKKGGLVLLAIVAGGIGLSYLDPNFNKVATLPDNVPIVGMIFLVGFFFWFAMNQAYVNDGRIAEGRPPIEGEDSGQKVFSWPDLVYVELICLVVVMAIMIVWSIALKAPLEEPANPTDSPNPAKAPWYFLGLQEMLVYFDPWLAGVVLPSLIIVGLMAIPYIDTNPKGNGYFTFKQRKVEISLFLFGWLVLWSQMIVIGTFLRGPNWNFFGPFEFWDPNKVEALVNVDLSEYVWIKALGVGLPGNWFLRELPGIILIAFYFFGLPVLLRKTRWFRPYYEKMGPARYYVGITLFLFMMLLPIKMYCRWLFNLKYFVHVQEYFFNI
jgi:cytochrome b/b6/petD-like protein